MSNSPDLDDADPTDYGHVLVLAGPNARVWHRPDATPDADDTPPRPRCGGAHAASRDEYHRRDPRSVLHLDACEACHGDDPNARGGRKGGTHLATQLRAMDADGMGLGSGSGGESA